MLRRPFASRKARAISSRVMPRHSRAASESLWAGSKRCNRAFSTAQIAEVTGWVSHTIRGFISIAKKKLGLEIIAQRTRTAGPNRQGSPGSSTTYFAK
ncbi:MAG: DUF3489 domain-containing protein [Magnetococcales bacterium]|nr:DUF3489 domain-containing protein [Magnetococcales bacterium]